MATDTTFGSLLFGEAQFGGPDIDDNDTVFTSVPANTPGIYGLMVFGQPMWLMVAPVSEQHSAKAVPGKARIFNLHTLPFVAHVDVPGRATIRRRNAI